MRCIRGQRGIFFDLTSVSAICICFYLSISVYVQWNNYIVNTHCSDAGPVKYMYRSTLSNIYLDCTWMHFEFERYIQFRALYSISEKINFGRKDQCVNFGSQKTHLLTSASVYFIFFFFFFISHITPRFHFKMYFYIKWSQHD